MLEYLFLIGVQVLAYLVGSVYYSSGIMATENPSDPLNSITLFVYILVATAIILLLLKLFKKGIIVLEGVAIFFSSELFFGAFLFFPLDIVLSSMLVILRFLFPSPLVLNACLFFSVAGVGGLLGASLDVFPLLIFAGILMLYDFVSVFLTKHMVYMAKEITSQPTALLASFQDKRVSRTTGRRYFMLGGGDLVVPSLIFTSFALRVSFISALPILIFTAIGLSILKFLLIKYRRPLPALVVLVPMCVLGCLVGGIFAWW